MNYLIAMASLFVSLSVNAKDCYMNLLGVKGVSDSSHFQINIALVSANTNEFLDEQTAVNSAQHLAQKYCGHKLAIRSVECAKPFLNLPPICYVKPYDLGGYLLVTKDYVDHVQVIFNRWD